MSKVTFEPVLDRIVIIPDEVPDVTEGGVVLPEGMAKERTQLGKVLAVGPGHLQDNGVFRPLQVKVGDRVLFSPYTETVTLDDVEYVLAREGDLYSILR